MCDILLSTKDAADVDVIDNVTTGSNVSSSSVGQAEAASDVDTDITNTGNASQSVEEKSTNISNVAKNMEQLLSTTTTKTTTTTTATMSSSAIPFALHFIASFHQICVVTALLPLVTLFTCFVTAYVFQYDEVHETHCRVYNIIPSISAITGVSPQRYFWRFSIALHIGPRLPIAFVYKNYYRSLINEMKRRRAPVDIITKANFLISLILVLNIIEVASLGGVTYISNRENYPVHERIFITFMTCSLCHMLATIKLHGMLHADPQQLTHDQRASIKWKKYLFVMSIASTIGLLIFFAKHRFYCHDLAFSWFAFFEYLIAVANMLFHFTIIWDFPSQYMIIVQGSRTKLEQLLNVANKKVD